MARKNWKWYVDNNDLLGCYERYKQAYQNWKDHWWETVTEIYDTYKEWGEKYVLDPIKREIIPRVKKVKAKIENLLANGGSNTYLVKFFDNYGMWVYTKIGKASDLYKRLNQQMNKTYKDGTTVVSYEIIKYYNLPTDDLALVLESFMRNHFRKNHTLIPNDRFEPFEPTEEDLEIFDKYYNLVLENA